MVTLVQFLVIFLTGTCQSMLNKSSLCFSCQMTWKERFQTNISVGATRVSSSAWRRHLQRDNLLQSTALDRGMVGGAEKEWKLRWLAREEDCSLLYEERRREEGDGVMEWWSDGAMQLAEMMKEKLLWSHNSSLVYHFTWWNTSAPSNQHPSFYPIRVFVSFFSLLVHFFTISLNLWPVYSIGSFYCLGEVVDIYIY